MPYPNIDNLQLAPCCKRSLKKIGEILKADKALHLVLPAGLFATIIASPSKGSALNTANSIKQTDFELFARAMLSIRSITCRSIRQVCADELLFKHKGGKLHVFWKTMYEIYSK